MRLPTLRGLLSRVQMPLTTMKNRTNIKGDRLPQKSISYIRQFLCTASSLACGRLAYKKIASLAVTHTVKQISPFAGVLVSVVTYCFFTTLAKRIPHTPLIATPFGFIVNNDAIAQNPEWALGSFALWHRIMFSIRVAVADGSSAVDSGGPSKMLFSRLLEFLPYFKTVKSVVGDPLGRRIPQTKSTTSKMSWAERNQWVAIGKTMKSAINQKYLIGPVFSISVYRAIVQFKKFYKSNYSLNSLNFNEKWGLLSTLFQDDIDEYGNGKHTRKWNSLKIKIESANFEKTTNFPDFTKDEREDILGALASLKNSGDKTKLKYPELSNDDEYDNYVGDQAAFAAYLCQKQTQGCSIQNDFNQNLEEIYHKTLKGDSYLAPLLILCRELSNNNYSYANDGDQLAKALQGEATKEVFKEKVTVNYNQGRLHLLYKRWVDETDFEKLFLLCQIVTGSRGVNEGFGFSFSQKFSEVGTCGSYGYIFCEDDFLHCKLKYEELPAGILDEDIWKKHQAKYPEINFQSWRFSVINNGDGDKLYVHNNFIGVLGGLMPYKALTKDQVKRMDDVLYARFKTYFEAWLNDPQNLIYTAK
jgi:hypothetical protein